MFFSGLLFGFLTVVSAATRPNLSAKALYLGNGSINITEYYHPPRVLHEDMLKGRKTLTFRKQWATSEISSSYSTSLWKKAILHCTRGWIRRSVYFLAHFQAPLLQEGMDSEANLYVYFIFSYDPLIEFEWGSQNISTSPRFEHVKTNCEDPLEHEAVFKVTCRPGTVFPLRFTVLNVQQDKLYDMRWTLSLDLKCHKPLSYQLVKMFPAGELMSDTRYSKGLPPIVEATSGPFDVLPLSSSMPGSAIFKFASHFNSTGEYLLEGYSKPVHALNTFVLSAKTDIYAQIALASLLKGQQYPLHTFFARKGMASEATVKMDTTKLYRVSITGILVDPAFSGFTLQVSALENAMGASYVELLVPDYQEEVLHWEKQAVGAGEEYSGASG